MLKLKPQSSWTQEAIAFLVVGAYLGVNIWAFSRSFDVVEFNKEVGWLAGGVLGYYFASKASDKKMEEIRQSLEKVHNGG